MIRHLSPRALGSLMLIGGAFVLWISMIEPLWDAIHGPVGTKVYVGFGMKGTFFSPFVILCGLTLLIGGNRAQALIDGDHPHGRKFWIGLATISLVAGGLNTWGFISTMESLNMRRDYAGHMIKGPGRGYVDETNVPDYNSPSRRKIGRSFITQEEWDAMKPETQAKMRRDEPETMPFRERYRMPDLKMPDVARNVR